MLSGNPVVKLINTFAEPYNNAIATARTCYSSRIVTEEDVAKDPERRDKIAKSIYAAGHHTIWQHATFQFALDKISRQVVWSFLHSHPFYNSEQVSQRYVTVKESNFAIPPLNDRELGIYSETIRFQMDAYKELIEKLFPLVEQEYFNIFRSRKKQPEKWHSAIRKKAQEVARYVLPIATHAHMYHTISGLTLHRYNRLCQQLDVPYEQSLVVNGMISEVNKTCPDFFKDIEDPIPLKNTLEYMLLERFELDSGNFTREFDEKLGGMISKLIDYKVNGEKTLAQAVRHVLGLTEGQVSDSEAIGLVLDPQNNPYLSEALNLNTISKLTRTLFHPQYTFMKRISHTADSQDQRHRMTPASRPVLMSQFNGEPDYVTPALIMADDSIQYYYERVMERVWQGIERLLVIGCKDEYASYLLPNAFPIRFEESADLLNLHHKLKTRLCYNAQEEIWRASMEEAGQIRELHPEIGRYIMPPCGIRKITEKSPYCPERERFCGVKVWDLKPEDYERLMSTTPP